ncbi:shikimate dehydrogenase [Burkholderia sp. Ac-20379]|uniref:shikimate dehydrogenase n=1 Tax=Burkholderia sp. Ac-20379 TaxID=2703900 RepID=UPI00197CB8A9|nr:shikimate dehydrogenase [Burkholderia sp. Ac-20379]MBN3726843.1 shikimate dehydrogenase [Burkholderia sp. Ac-20379]
MSGKTDKTSFLIGLIGQGIGGSLSPAMHEREGGLQGFNYVYRRLDLDVLQMSVDELPKLLDLAERMGFDGLNITYPCKQRVIEHLDTLSDDARALGAVNTVRFADGKRSGHNTDWSGFARSFRRGLEGVSLARVVQIGAGGAGAAVAHAALMLGAGALTIFDVDAARAASLAGELQTRFPQAVVTAGGALDAAMAQATGLIHATPTGMAKHPGLPLPAELLAGKPWVADIVYFPLETELIRVAREMGCRTLPGGGMAVYQAVDAFEIFTGREPDAERMFSHFESLVAR